MSQVSKMSKTVVFSSLAKWKVLKVAESRGPVQFCHGFKVSRVSLTVVSWPGE